MSQEQKDPQGKPNPGQGGGQDHETVSIHIGKGGSINSPNPTTGVALYLLGKVDALKFDLFREVHGKGDDELIPNDQTVVQLKNGDQFYTSQKSLNPGTYGNASNS